MLRSRPIASLAGHQSGNVMILAALSMSVLVGTAGLATDTIQWANWKRDLQREADSGAIAGAIANYQGNSAALAANRTIARYDLVRLTATPTVEVGPTSGPGTGDAQAVRVVLQTSRSLPFSSLFMSRAATISAEATAKTVDFGDYCVVSLENSTATGITLQGNASVDLGCGMVTNSQSSTAIYAGGSSYVNASPVAAVGIIPASNNFAAGTVIQSNTMAQVDPLRDLANPTPGSCSGQLSVGPNTTRNISNPDGTSCYSGMNLKGTVNFAPGIYYVDGGALSIGSQARVTGNGVVFVLTSRGASTNPTSIATLDINGGATISLIAPGSGPFAGVLFYQDRRALTGTTNTVNGNASSKLQGAIYFPSQNLQFSGDSGMITDCVQLISRNITFIGNNAISNSCPADSGSPTISGLQVRLIN